MDRILYYLPDIIFASIISILFLLLINKKIIKNNKKMLLCLIFEIYLISVWTLVGLPNILYIRLSIMYNIIPFKGMISDLLQNILNVLLFVPLGILLPLLLGDKYKNVKNVLIIGLLNTCIIEFLQIFTYRATDINDIITNMLGTIIGYLMYLIINRIFISKKSNIDKGFIDATNKIEKECNLIKICYILVFIIMFIIEPVVFKIIYLNM